MAANKPDDRITTNDPAQVAQQLSCNINALGGYAKTINDATHSQLIETFENTPIDVNGTPTYLHAAQAAEFLHHCDTSYFNPSQLIALSCFAAHDFDIFNPTHEPTMVELIRDKPTNSSTPLISDPAYLLQFYLWAVDIVSLAESSQTHHMNAVSTEAVTDTNVTPQAQQQSHWQQHICGFSHTDFTQLSPANALDTSTLFSKKGPIVFLFDNCRFDDTTLAYLFAHLATREAPSNNKKTLRFHNTIIDSNFIRMFTRLLQVSHRCHIEFTGDMLLEDRNGVENFVRCFNPDHYKPGQANLASLKFNLTTLDAKMKAVLKGIISCNPVINEMSINTESTNCDTDNNKAFWQTLKELHQQLASGIIRLTYPALNEISTYSPDANPITAKQFRIVTSYLTGELKKFPIEAFITVVRTVHMVHMANPALPHNCFLSTKFDISRIQYAEIITNTKKPLSKEIEKQDNFWTLIFLRLTQERQSILTESSTDIYEFEEHMYQAYAITIQWLLLISLLQDIQESYSIKLSTEKLPTSQEIAARINGMSEDYYGDRTNHVRAYKTLRNLPTAALTFGKLIEALNDYRYLINYMKLLDDNYRNIGLEGNMRKIKSSLFQLPQEYYITQLRRIYEKFDTQNVLLGKNLDWNHIETLGKIHERQVVDYVKVALRDLLQRRFNEDKTTQIPLKQSKVDDSSRKITAHEKKLYDLANSEEPLTSEYLYEQLTQFVEATKTGKMTEKILFIFNIRLNDSDFNYIMDFINAALAVLKNFTDPSMHDNARTALLKSHWQPVTDIIKVYNLLQAPEEIIKNQLRIAQRVGKQETDNPCEHAERPEENERLAQLIDSLAEQANLSKLNQGPQCNLLPYQVSFNGTIMSITNTKRTNMRIKLQQLIGQVKKLSAICEDIAATHAIPSFRQQHLKEVLIALNKLNTSLNTLGQADLIQTLGLEQLITDMRGKLAHTATDAAHDMASSSHKSTSGTSVSDPATSSASSSTSKQAAVAQAESRNIRVISTTPVSTQSDSSSATIQESNEVQTLLAQCKELGIELENDPILQAYQCCICQDITTHPVRHPDEPGRLFDKPCISNWFDTAKGKGETTIESPETKAVLSVNATLQKDVNVINAITAYLKQLLKTAQTQQQTSVDADSTVSSSQPTASSGQLVEIPSTITSAASSSLHPALTGPASTPLVATSTPSAATTQSAGSSAVSTAKQADLQTGSASSTFFTPTTDSSAPIPAVSLSGRATTTRTAEQAASVDAATGNGDKSSSIRVPTTPTRAQTSSVNAATGTQNEVSSDPAAATQAMLVKAPDVPSTEPQRTSTSSARPKQRATAV